MERLIDAKARLDKARDTFEKNYNALLSLARINLAIPEESILARQDLEERMMEGLEER